MWIVRFCALPVAVHFASGKAQRCTGIWLTARADWRGSHGVIRAPCRVRSRSRNALLFMPMISIAAWAVPQPARNQVAFTAAGLRRTCADPSRECLAAGLGSGSDRRSREASASSKRFCAVWQCLCPALRLSDLRDVANWRIRCGPIFLSPSDSVLPHKR